jgi:two-component system, NtrC family, nitrogen regulation response regulator GlnG
VRQLENMCHWLTVMAPAQTIDVKDLPPEVLGISEKLESSAASYAINTIASSAHSITAIGHFDSENLRSEDTQAVHPPAASTVLKTASAAHVPVSAAHSNGSTGWEDSLESEALQLLAKEEGTTWDELTRRFERRLIQAALSTTRGRRIEAAVKLGIGRNTITRKIQELGLE